MEERISRSENSRRNIISGFLNKILSLGVPFVIRTVIIREFGVDYLGLSSLFSSILQVLSVAELGVSSSIVFSLYEPLSKKDTKTVCALMSFYRKTYRVIGLIILCAGVFLAPFLPNLINGEYPGEINIYFLYFLYLINTVISYFAFGYKGALLTASQQYRVINNIESAITIGKGIIQIFVLVVVKNYYMFVLCVVISTIFNNIFIALKTKKKFPQYKSLGKIDSKTKKNIVKQVKGLAIGTFSKTARNSFDSIVLSIYCGLSQVAIYSNYFFIMSSILGFLNIVTTSIRASVGNSLVLESNEKNYNDCRRFSFVYNVVFSVCTVCLFCLYQPFMKIWVGESLMAPTRTMVLFCIYFYITSMGQIRAIYSSASGIWWEFRWLEIGEMISNLLLNFVLGYFWGLDGIILTTIITVFFFSIFANTKITYHKCFQKSSLYYWKDNIPNIFITVLIALVSYFFCSKVKRCDVIGLFERTAILFFVSGIIFTLFIGTSKRNKQYCLTVYNNFVNKRGSIDTLK